MSFVPRTVLATIIAANRAFPAAVAWSLSGSERGMKILAFILLAALTACSTSSHRHSAQAHVTLSPEYWHAPPSIVVLHGSLRAGMSSDELARLIGVLEPAWISATGSHYCLPDGTLTIQHHTDGSLLSWDVQQRVTQ
jgi:hypothetical protein